MKKFTDLNNKETKIENSRNRSEFINNLVEESLSIENGEIVGKEILIDTLKQILSANDHKTAINVLESIKTISYQGNLNFTWINEAIENEKVLLFNENELNEKLTAKQKKLPKGLQAAILKKQGEKPEKDDEEDDKKEDKKDEKDEKDDKPCGLSKKQMKLPKALRDAILKKMKKKGKKCNEGLESEDLVNEELFGGELSEEEKNEVIDYILTYCDTYTEEELQAKTPKELMSIYSDCCDEDDEEGEAFFNDIDESLETIVAKTEEELAKEKFLTEPIEESLLLDKYTDSYTMEKESLSSIFKNIMFENRQQTKEEKIQFILEHINIVAEDIEGENKEAALKIMTDIQIDNLFTSVEEKI